MLAYVGTGLAGLSLLLNIVGLAIPDWLVGLGTKYGLWKVCVGGFCVSIPSTILDATWQSTRAFEVLGTLAIAATLGCAILKLFVMKEHKLLPKLSGASAIAAAFFMIVGAIIFAANTEYPGMTLDAGFALCIVAGVIAIVAAILILLGFKEA